MKATYRPVMICECGYVMFWEYFGLRTSPSLVSCFRCVNHDCKYYGKHFKAPVFDIELVELDGK